MDLDHRVLERLLHIPPGGICLGEFSVLAEDFQTERRYLLFYSNDDTRVLVTPHDRLGIYRQVFPAGYAGTDVEVLEQAKALENDRLDVIGPIFISLLAPETFTFQKQAVVNGFPVIKLDESHVSALQALQAACKPIEWDHASLNLDDLSTAYGALDGDAVAAAAHTLIFDQNIASVGVVTHPEYRGKGLVTALSVWAINHALDAGNHVIYRTMGWNTAAIQVARKLGFTEAGEYTIMKTEEE